MAEDRTSDTDLDIIYRYTGDERDEFGTDENMPWQRRLDIFAGIELELGRAEIYLEKGVNKFDVYGDMKDIEDAVSVLKASAEYHANRFSSEQLREAADHPKADTGLLGAIAYRRAATERTNAAQSLVDRMKAVDESWDVRNRDQDERLRDDGRDEKG